MTMKIFLIAIIFFMLPQIGQAQLSGVELIRLKPEKRVLLQLHQPVKISYRSYTGMSRLKGMILGIKDDRLFLRNSIQSQKKLEPTLNIHLSNITQIKKSSPFLPKLVNVVGGIGMAYFGYWSVIGVLIQRSRPDLGPAFRRIGFIGLGISFGIVQLTKQRKYKIQEGSWQIRR